MKTPVFEKIVWAVDILEPPEFQQNARFILGALTREMPASVFPVHVQCYSFPKAEKPAIYDEAYSALAEKRLKQLKESLDIVGLQNGDLLADRKGTTRSSVEQLIKYAKEKNADVIVVSTHSHGAVAKLFLGSFAETLLLQSDISVISVNPKTKVRETISKVLFPTTFDKKYISAFEKTLDLCSALGAGLTAFYKFPQIPFIEMSPELFEWQEEDAAILENDIRLYRDKALAKNVPLEVRIEPKPGDVANEIATYAGNHGFDLIAMVSQPSDDRGLQIGSICRKVVRSAPCPVWTFKLGAQ